MDKPAFKAVSIINVVLLSIIFVSNIFIAFTRQQLGELLIFGIFTFFFLLVLSIYIMITKNNFFMGILYIIIGLLCTVLGGQGNLSGIIFIIFALMIYKSMASIYIIISLLLVAILGKAIYFKYNIFETVNIIIMYIGIYTIFYFLVFKKVVKNGSDFS